MTNRKFFITSISILFFVVCIFAANIVLCSNNVYADEAYTITWKNGDDILEVDDGVEVGAIPEYNGETPTKAPDDDYIYTFSGWTPTIEEVSGDAVYTATFSQTANSFTIVWKNGDDVLETDDNVKYGATPSYDGETPTKAATAQYTYTFAGWTPAIEEVSDDAVYTATFSSTINEYTVYWENYDGTILETDENVPYGETPTYDGEMPTKDSSGQKQYTFSGWSPEISTVTGNVIYIAQFDEDWIYVTATWLVDGVAYSVDQYIIIGSEPIYSGDNPSKASDENYTYVWTGWDPTVGEIYVDTVYNATFDAIPKQYTVEFLSGDHYTLTAKKGEDIFESGDAVTKDDIIIFTLLVDDGYSVDLFTITPEVEDKYSFDTSTMELSSVRSNIVITCSASPARFTITYDDYLDNKEDVVEYGSNYVLQIPIRPGFVFDGWYYGLVQLTDSQGESLNPYNYYENINIISACTIIELSIDHTSFMFEDGIGDVDTIVATITPLGATNVIFTSLNENIVRVDEIGNVTCVGVGRAKVRATLESGGAYMECEYACIDKVISMGDTILYVTINENVEDNKIAVLCSKTDLIETVSDLCLEYMAITNDYIARTDLGVEILKSSQIDEIFIDLDTLNLNLIYSISKAANNVITYRLSALTAEYGTSVYLLDIVAKDGYKAGDVIVTNLDNILVEIHQGSKYFVMPNIDVVTDVLLKDVPVSSSTIKGISVNVKDGINSTTSIVINSIDKDSYNKEITFSGLKESIYVIKVVFKDDGQEIDYVDEYTITFTVPQEFISRDGLQALYYSDGQVYAKLVEIEGNTAKLTLMGSGDIVFIANVHESTVYLYWLIVVLLFLDSLLAMILVIQIVNYQDALERRRTINGYSTIFPVALLGAIVAGEIGMVAFLGLVFVVEVIAIAWFGLKLTNKYFIYTTYHKIANANKEIERKKDNDSVEDKKNSEENND